LNHQHRHEILTLSRLRAWALPSRPEP
jgi:hypothetical protein